MMKRTTSIKKKCDTNPARPNPAAADTDELSNSSSVRFHPQSHPESDALRTMLDHLLRDNGHPPKELTKRLTAKRKLKTFFRGIKKFFSWSSKTILSKKDAETANNLLDLARAKISLEESDSELEKWKKIKKEANALASDFNKKNKQYKLNIETAHARKQTLSGEFMQINSPRPVLTPSGFLKKKPEVLQSYLKDLQRFIEEETKRIFDEKNALHLNLGTIQTQTRSIENEETHEYKNDESAILNINGTPQSAQKLNALLKNSVFHTTFETSNTLEVACIDSSLSSTPYNSLLCRTENTIIPEGIETESSNALEKHSHTAALGEVGPPPKIEEPLAALEPEIQYTDSHDTVERKYDPPHLLDTPNEENHATTASPKQSLPPKDVLRFQLTPDHGNSIEKILEYLRSLFPEDLPEKDSAAEYKSLCDQLCLRMNLLFAGTPTLTRIQSIEMVDDHKKFVFSLEHLPANAAAESITSTLREIFGNAIKPRIQISVTDKLSLYLENTAILDWIAQRAKRIGSLAYKPCVQVTNALLAVGLKALPKALFVELQEHLTPDLHKKLRSRLEKDLSKLFSTAKELEKTQETCRAQLDTVSLFIQTTVYNGIAAKTNTNPQNLVSYIEVRSKNITNSENRYALNKLHHTGILGIFEHFSAEFEEPAAHPDERKKQANWLSKYIETCLITKIKESNREKVSTKSILISAETTQKFTDNLVRINQQTGGLTSEKTPLQLILELLQKGLNDDLKSLRLDLEDGVSGSINRRHSKKSSQETKEMKNQRTILQRLQNLLIEIEEKGPAKIRVSLTFTNDHPDNDKISAAVIQTIHSAELTSSKNWPRLDSGLSIKFKKNFKTNFLEKTKSPLTEKYKNVIFGVEPPPPEEESGISNPPMTILGDTPFSVMHDLDKALQFHSRKKDVQSLTERYLTNVFYRVKLLTPPEKITIRTDRSKNNYNIDTVINDSKNKQSLCETITINEVTRKGIEKLKLRESRTGLLAFSDESVRDFSDFLGEKGILERKPIKIEQQDLKLVDHLTGHYGDMDRTFEELSPFYSSLQILFHDICPSDTSESRRNLLLLQTCLRLGTDGKFFAIEPPKNLKPPYEGPEDAPSNKNPEASHETPPKRADIPFPPSTKGRLSPASLRLLNNVLVVELAKIFIKTDFFLGQELVEAVFLKHSSSGICRAHFYPSYAAILQGLEPAIRVGLENIRLCNISGSEHATSAISGPDNRISVEIMMKDSES